MVTEAEVRAIALALPETEEREHMGHPDFRVRGRVFGGFPSAGRMSLRLDAAAQAALLATAPAAFTPAAGAWGRRGWTVVELARVDGQELRELIEEAWRLRAPKRLVAAHDAAGG